MAGNTTKVVFELFGRDQASPVFDKFGRKVRQTEKDIHFLSSATKGLLAGFAGYATIGAATNFLRESNEEARESQKVNALTANALQTTGAIAWSSSKQIGTLSDSISAKTAVDDEAVQTGANLLLTFKKVRNEVGAGSAIFDRATAAAVDLSASGFGSIDSASKMLGKSLNDPVKGVTALSRAGVTFTAGQKKQIAQMVEQNDLLGAQKVILREVESQVKGSAAAQATSGEKATLAYKNAQEAIGTALLPVIDEVSEAFTKRAGPAAQQFAAFLTDDGIPAAKGFFETVKPIAADVLPAVAEAGERVVDVLKFVAPMLGKVAEGFGNLPSSATNALLLGVAVKTMGGNFGSFNSKSSEAIMNLRTMPNEMRNAAVKTAALKTGVGVAGGALLLFADDIRNVNKPLGDVASVLGAAAVGFTTAGPWGAAIAGTGALLSTFGSSNKNAIPDVDALTDALDTQTGALTANARAQILAALNDRGEDGKGESTIDKANRMGVSPGDVTDASMGDAAALRRIKQQRDRVAAEQAALAEAQSPGSGGATSEGVKRNFDELTDSITDQKNAVGLAKSQWDNLNESTSRSRELNKLTSQQIRDVRKATDDIPRNVVSKFTQPGYEKAEQNAADIAKKYDLSRKDVRTALKALDYSSPQIKKVLALMRDADRTVRPKVVADTGDSLSKLQRLQGYINGMNGKTLRVSTSGGGGGGGGITKATGGPIFGPGTGTSDDVPVMASNGEHMLTAREVSALGGHAGVMRIRKAALAGQVQTLASGGPVGRQDAYSGPAGPSVDQIARAFAAVLRGGLDVTVTDSSGRSMRGKLKGAR